MEKDVEKDLEKDMEKDMEKTKHGKRLSVENDVYTHVFH